MYYSSKLKYFNFLTIKNRKRMNTIKTFPPIHNFPFSRIVKPAGTHRLLHKLDVAYKEGFTRILIHGLGGTGKTLSAIWYVWKNFNVPPRYISLPCTPDDAYHFYCYTKSLMLIPNKAVIVIIDELEKIVNREVIGWLCKTLDLNPPLVIGITNEPAYIKNNIHAVWRRFVGSGVLIYAPPPNFSERVHIAHAAAKKLKKPISRDEAKMIAVLLEGYNFPEVVHLFKLALNIKGEITYATISELVKNRVVQPSNTPKDEEKYINDLHDIPSWDIILH